MDGGAWWATVHGVPKSRPRLGDFSLSLQLRNTDYVSFLNYEGTKGGQT